jgi:hypothetical protein
MIALKFLGRGGVGLFSAFAWPLPQGGRPGRWLETGTIDACRTGVHACHLHDLVRWLDDELWTIELGGEIDVTEGVIVATRGRLLNRVESWTDDLARELAETCVWRCQGHACEALLADGHPREAARLASVGDLATLESEGRRISRAVEGFSGVAAAAAADAAVLLRGGWFDGTDPGHVSPPRAAATAANLAFVTAHDAGQEAARGEASGHAYREGFASERAWQAAWLIDRLQIPADGPTLPATGSAA